MEFAICLKGDLSLERTVALCQQAEVAGFDYAWFFDCHVRWRECYTTMALCMASTHRIRFGPCVSNPGVREWTVAASIFANLCDISKGRFTLGVGRGERTRLPGHKPCSLREMVDFGRFAQAMARGESVEFLGRDQQLAWTDGHQMPVWYAAYGPKALAEAGSHADGFIVQLADPWLVRRFAEQAREAAQAEGRDPRTLRIMAAAPAWTGDYRVGLERTRWFPPTAAQPVADLVESYRRGGGLVPQHLIDHVAQRGQPSGDEAVASFAVLGSPEQHVARLKELQQAGVTQFNLYLMCGEEERILAEYAEHVLPRLRD